MEIYIPDINDCADIIDNPFRSRFPLLVLSESGMAVLNDEVFKDRKPVNGVTISRSHLMDLEDAIYVEENADGYSVDVSISDVDSLVVFNSHVDKEAMKRAKAHDFSSCRVPMIPERLSEGLLSLLEGQPRPTITVHIELSKNFDVKDVRLEKTFIESEERLTYGTAEKVLKGEVISKNQHMLEAANRLAHMLLAKRKDEGAIAIYDFARLVATGEEGGLHKLGKGEANDAYIIVEELMILANKAIAKILRDHMVPNLFVNHALNERMPTCMYMMERLASLGDMPVEDLMSEFNGFVERAVYGVEPHGHSGLCVEQYVHATSPIRRYSDLVVHRVIKAFIDGEDPLYSQKDLETVATYLNAKLKFIHRRRCDVQWDLRLDRARFRISRLKKEEFIALNDDDWDIYLKIACKEGLMTEEFLQAIYEKIDRNELSSGDAYYILFRSIDSAISLDTLKVKVLTIVIKSPGVAKQVILLARDKGAIEELNIPIVRDGVNSFTSTVFAKMNGIWFSSQFQAVGQNKKAAEYKAIELFLEDMLANNLVQIETPLLLEVPEEDQGEPFPATMFDSLFDLCRLNGWLSPKFDVIEDDSVNLKFQYKITVFTPAEVYGVGEIKSSRRKAKGSAAQALLPLLEGLSSVRS